MISTFFDGIQIIKTFLKESLDTELKEYSSIIQIFPLPLDIGKIIVGYATTPHFSINIGSKKTSICSLSQKLYDELIKWKLYPFTYEMNSIFITHIFSTNSKLARDYVYFFLVIENSGIYPKGYIRNILDGGDKENLKDLRSMYDDYTNPDCYNIRERYNHRDKLEPPKLERQLALHGGETSYYAYLDILKMLDIPTT
jgi:hypothetical protein